MYYKFKCKTCNIIETDAHSLIHECFTGESIPVNRLSKFFNEHYFHDVEIEIKGEIT